MFQKFDIRYKYDITFYQIKKKGRVDPAEMTRGRVDSGAEMETGRVDPPPWRLGYETISTAIFPSSADSRRAVVSF